MTQRILLGQLGSNGDCLYATILARQLRHDYPDAEITWAISSQCAGVIANNPHIDEVWRIPVPGWDQHDIAWRNFEREALRLYGRRQFDQVLLSQIWPENFQNYDGTIRSSILRSYGHEITVPIENVITLSDAEIEQTRDFVRLHRIAERNHRIIFECSSKSGQSFVTPEIAQSIADELYRILPDATVIFSTHLPMELRDSRSCYAGSLSLRQIAELTHHASAFVGCGSGGTVAASSTASRALPMVQLLSASTSVFASFAHDFEYFGLNERSVVELTDERPAEIARCIAAMCKDGIAAARSTLTSEVPLSFDHFTGLIDQMLIRRQRSVDAARAVSITAERYGWDPSLVAFGKERIEPTLQIDPAWNFAHNKRAAEEFRSALHSAGEGERRARQRLWSEGSAFIQS